MKTDKRYVITGERRKKEKISATKKNKRRKNGYAPQTATGLLTLMFIPAAPELTIVYLV